MNSEPQRYRAYLLRLWPGTENWRVTLEDARSGERLAFACLEELFAHLMQVAESGGLDDKPRTQGDQGCISQ